MPTQRIPAILAALLLLLIFTLSGCGSAGLVGPKAEQVGELFYAALKKGDFAAAADLYVKKRPRAEIIQELEEYKQRLGDLQSYKMKDVVVSTVFSGVRYIIRYKTQYTQIKATEGLIMFQSVSDDFIRIEIRNVQTRRAH